MLTLSEYQQSVDAANRFGDKHSLAAPLLGVFGETGGLLTVAKKRLREVNHDVAFQETVTEELGDVLWYLAALLSSAGLTIAEAVNTLKSESVSQPNSEDTFLILDEKLGENQTETDRDSVYVDQVLMPLASAVGHLVSQFHSGKLANDSALLLQQVGQVMQALIEVASASGVRMQKVAEKNRDKVLDRWPQTRFYRENFDASFDDEDERFPNEIVIDVFEKEVGGKTYVYQRCEGVFIGDRLTDNKIENDDYRFHDVFHYSYAAVLSWSPVLRRLLKRKRKSNSDVDDAEDGARAAIIEEGVVAWIFAQSLESPTKHFANVERGALSFGMLKQIRKFTKGYEVAELPLWQWEEAILQGYEAFRYIIAHRSARLTINTATHKLTFGEIP